MSPTIRVQAEDFDAAAEEALLTAGRRDVGAVVAFTGLCRDEDGTLAALELEHYPGMAEEEIRRVAGEALSRWPLVGLTIIHRHGVIRPGERIVLVIAAARHRGEAFAAAEFLMDYLKTRAPFWKKERRVDGAEGGWVAAKTEDDAAALRWER
ncbi:molybdenum cofactor biosynthesis protein MoaE [Methylocystis sp. MJC1]|uniref:molybdenum cofactor biosynthesis protein MoaE n=1 Tax=Methylocystis sp. MJC1 TaxID=2654282 RepID=UPI0013E9CBA0|nr:molybdenum cofactor biosynthesis protein MoaE [Methylocystis sp. MJC1]MBU6527179.1 molybdenum cofactor biosynthesis protein MoaE [Methylocystis sp. MJC1]UZX13717.1 molybdenum cofactor biosynthesis protein MoaE [Methylocystis sp. MJC1]